jgi:hypothetical protein
MMFFAGNPSYGNMAGLSYVTFDLVSILLTIGTIIAVMILATLNLFGSGLDAGVLRYVYGLVVLIGIMFQVTFTLNSTPIDIGLGLLSNVLYPYFNPSSTNLFSDIGLILSSIFGMITLGSGIIMIGGGS